MGIEIVKSGQLWQNFSMLIYGRPGVGKTWLAGTSIQVPDLCPVLLCDNDGGSLTVQGKAQFDGIDITRVNKFTDYNDIYAYLTGEAAGKYRTVIIDNLSAVYELAMDAEMTKAVNKDRNREFEVPSQREYGIVRKQIQKLVTHFRDLENTNFITTCHAEIKEDELSKIARIRQALPGKLSYEIAGMLNVVGYLDVAKPTLKERNQGIVNEVRILYVQPYRQVDAKDQSDALGDKVENPDMGLIWSLIQNSNHK